MQAAICALDEAANKLTEKPFDLESANRYCFRNSVWLLGSHKVEPKSVTATSIMDWECLTDYVTKVMSGIYPLFIFSGAITSIIFLVSAVIAVNYFRRLQSDRNLLHCHLMIALVLRTISLAVVSGPLVLNVRQFYKKLDFFCRMVLSFDMFATASVITWSCVQGLYLHCRMFAANVNAQYFKAYYLVGWLVPLVLVCVFNLGMAIHTDKPCWAGYSETKEISHVSKGLLMLLVLNSALLMNLVRIVLTAGNNSVLDANHYRRALYTYLITTPVLAINYILFMNGPQKKDPDTIILLFHTAVGATQGLLTVMTYFFCYPEIRAIIGEEWTRGLGLEAAPAPAAAAAAAPAAPPQRQSNRERILPPALTNSNNRGRRRNAARSVPSIEVTDERNDE